jgi:hypothetical protein
MFRKDQFQPKFTIIIKKNFIFILSHMSTHRYVYLCGGDAKVKKHITHEN